MTSHASEKNENSLVLFFYENGDYFSSDAIYDANEVFQNFDKNVFGKLLFKLAIESFLTQYDILSNQFIERLLFM